MERLFLSFLLRLQGYSYEFFSMSCLKRDYSCYPQVYIVVTV